MRIIHGKYKGRRFPQKKFQYVRPTTDFVKEALFNYLYSRISFKDLEVLELFAGTGHVGFEFISRGAQKVTFIDFHPEAVQYMRMVSSRFQIPKEQIEIVKADVERFLTKFPPVPYDIVFMDPPYQYPKTPYLLFTLFSRGWVKPNGYVIVEHKRGLYMANYPYFIETRNYGRSALSIFIYKSQDKASENYRSEDIFP